MNKTQVFLLRFGAFALTGVVYVVFLILGVGCPIRSITGIPCAGCGMTRAYLSLLNLDFHSAFHYHPLFWMVPIVLIIIFVKKGPLANTKFRNILFTLIIIIFALVYILRLLIIKDSAIYIN